MPSKKIIIIATILLCIGGGIFAYEHGHKGASAIVTIRQNEKNSTSSQSLDNTSGNIRAVIIEEAVALVTALPDVKSTSDLLKSKNKELIIEPTEELQYDNNKEPYWGIHVYEDVGDHLATYGWYKVYQKGGRIAE